MKALIGERGSEQNFILRQGATFGYFCVELTNDDDTPVDLTGCSIHAKIRKTAFSGKVYTLNTNITDATNGKFNFGLDATDNQGIQAGASENDPASAYVLNVDITFSNGEVFPLFYGDVFVISGLSQ
jgi:BppU N-terminal domain